MRTITLELVRHGPAHNQLLSPLTQYLALCENHPAVTLQLPLEHNQMLYRLGALSYRMGTAPREFQLRDTAAMLGGLLALIPGLTADMNRLDGADEGDATTHLRLVLSASELALLPFELALAPTGFPGAGQPLLLQSLRPVSITRETRRVAEERVTWPEQTRVLFVVAAPPGTEPPPAAAHLLALRRALEPWIGTRPGADDAARQERIGQHLQVLTEASLEAIEHACAQGRYTHVHILAHGGEYREGYDTRFGLMLHAAGNPLGAPDFVSGERLATALRAARRGAAGQLARPAVVTLASCNSGNVGTVTGVGASIAHALHADGIPMVIASQFPLSFAGSVRMVEMLYDGLLWGEDPRAVLVDLRRTLHTQFSETHDWASITAYSSLPADFDQQLATVQVQRARRSIDVAVELADEVVSRIPRTRRSRSTPGSLGGLGGSAPTLNDNEVEQELQAAMRRVRASKGRLERLLGRRPGQRARIVSLLASAEKREAALAYESMVRLSDRSRLQAEVWGALERARQLYDEAMGADPVSHWLAVQYLSLTAVLQAAQRLPHGPEPASRRQEALWDLAEVQSQRDLAGASATARGWAHGNLLELYLLAPAIPAVAVRYPHDWLARAQQHARELVALAQPRAFEIYSTRRQMVRYLDLYGELCKDVVPNLLAPAVAIAEQVVELLPEQPPDDTAPTGA